jgi:hypothetical protein
MKVLFGNLSQQDLDWSDGSFETFTDECGTEFEFQISANQDGLTITDSIGRLVPIAYQDYDSLMSALKMFKPICKGMVKAQKAQDALDAEDLFAIY